MSLFPAYGDGDGNRKPKLVDASAQQISAEGNEV